MYAAVSIDVAEGIVIAAPMPWSARITIRVIIFFEKPPPIPTTPINKNPVIKTGLGW